jgi:hypothetical protein
LPLLPDASLWRTLTPEQWGALFLPGIACGAPPPPSTPASLGAIALHAAAAADAVAMRQYLLAPVGGSAAYERRGRTEGAPGPGEAAQHVALRLDTLAGRLSREQVGHFQLMGAALSAALRRAPHAHLRPPGPVSSAPAAWWRYAVAATADIARAAGRGRMRWDRLRTVAVARRRYVSMYKAHIIACAKKAGKKAGPPTRSTDPNFLELEQSLETESALLFRVLAHREVAAEAAAVGSNAKPSIAAAAGPSPAKPAGRMARFFGSYLSSSSSSTALAQSESASPVSADAGSALGLSSDDWAQLGEVFELTDDKISAATAAPLGALHPEAMSFRATLTVDVGSVQLVSGAPDAPPLLLSSLAGITAVLRQFSAPRLCASIGIVSLSADAAGVPLLRTTFSSGDAAMDGAVSALALEYEKAPLDGHADTVVSLATAPIHITADLAAVRGLVTFFAKPAGLDTAALAQTMNDTVSDAAAAAAAAAEDSLKSLQGRSLKMDLRLAVAAPKILLPTPNGAGLLLDLGFLQLESAAPTAGTPRGTECFNLALNDVSATFVEPGWDWSRLGEHGSAGAGAQPLLSPTGLTATLVRCAAPGPGRPGLALSVDIHALAAEISPSSIARLLRVLAVLSPLWTREGAPWDHATHEAPIWVLTRNGTSPGRLVWARRWGVLAGEYLYLLEARDTPANAKVAFVSLRHGMDAAPLPARAAAGQAGVLTVLPHGVQPARATSHSRATLLRGDDAAGSALWLSQLRGVRKRRHIAAARRRVAATSLAPGGAALAVQLDGLDHLIGSDEEDAFADASAVEAGGSSDGEAEADGQADRFSDADSEMESDDSVSDSGSDSGAAASAADAAAIESFVLLARMDTLTVALAGAAPRGAPASAPPERAVVTLRMAGAAVRYGQRMHDLSLAVRLQSLVVIDCLAASPRPGAPEPYVLTSEATAVADSFPHYLHRTVTAPSVALDAALSSVSSVDAAAGGEDANALVRFSYRTWSENSPDYAGSTCDITARLAAVALALRRPTVAALTALSYDYAPQRPPAGTAPQAAPPVQAAPAEQDTAASESGTATVAATTAALVAWASGAGPEEKVAPAGLGGAPRVVMRIDVVMESALAQLLLEGACVHAYDACGHPHCCTVYADPTHAAFPGPTDGTELSAASVENLSAVLTLRQATLELVTSLGNVRLRDGRSPEGHAYRWILDLREHQAQAVAASASGKAAPIAGSLIALTFATHVKGCASDHV